MNEQERNAKIESYGNAGTLLLDTLQQYPKEMWQFRAFEDEWTIHEIIVHISDSEANSYVRCRRLIAEPGKPVMAYDESGWADKLQYHAQSTEEALELFMVLRRNSYHLIRHLPQAVFAHTIYHPENGTMSFDDWLTTYEDHVPYHLKKMQANYEVWQRLKM